MMIHSDAVTIAEHCKDHVLLIPEGLSSFEDATAVITHGTAGIFHKLIHENALNVEFFTNAPCLAYVVRGYETFYASDGDEIIVSAGQTLLLPRHHHMVSSFVNDTGPLEAWLFFFSDPVIETFLQLRSPTALSGDESHPALLPETSGSSKRLSAFVAALSSVYGGLDASFALTKTKLVELLLLIEAANGDGRILQFLLNQNPDHARRNIKQVMRQTTELELSIPEFARLAGRSVSAFQRDFKREFDMTPGAWLREARLERGRELILTSQGSVSEVAHLLGYADTSHFIRAFKAKFGYTPKQMRQRLK